MEIFILLVIVAVLIWFVSKQKKHDPSKKEHKPPVGNYLQTQRAASKPSTPPAFDAKSAEKLETRRVLKGRAYVIDGDSIVIRKTQVRIFGVDAPEINHPYGQKAKWAMVSLCKGHDVCAEILAEDDHGRTVARCTLPDGRDLSAEMVKLGLAIDWPKFSGGEYRNLETPDARKKLWLADARQKGRMYVWEKFEANQAAKAKRS